MKWMIASDLHGSALYTGEMLERFRLEGADRLLLLGDLLYHGPRNDLPQDYAPKEVIGMLNEAASRIFCVRGNCEAEVDQMVLNFPVLAEYCLLDWAGRLVFATHGHRYNQEAPPALAAGEVLLHGHTHVPAKVQTSGGWWYLNPGSVSLPKEGSARGYMVWEGERLVWKTLAGEAYDSLTFSS